MKKEQLVQALDNAAHAHHEYETKVLKGVRDEKWPEWYAGFVLKQLGNFAAPAALAKVLSTTDGPGNWSENAAKNILKDIAPAAAPAPRANKPKVTRPAGPR